MTFKVIIFAALVAFTHAGFISQPAQVAFPAVARVAAPVAVAEHIDPHPQYQYSYDIQDEITGDSKNHQEIRDGDNVEGSYSLTDPDGFRRTVHYTADHVNGFIAHVHREPLAARAAVAVPVAKVAPAQAVLNTPARTISFAAPQVASHLTYAAPQVATTQTYGAPHVASHLTYAAPQVATTQTYGAPHVASHLTYAAPQVASHLTYAAPQVASHLTYAAPQVATTQTYGAPHVASHLTYAAPQVASHLTYAAPLQYAAPVQYLQQ